MLGAPAWAKAVKFAISVSAYGSTLLWMLHQLKTRRRAAQFIANASAVLLFIEIAAIVLQVILGLPSHFNVAKLASEIPVWVKERLLQ